MGVITGAIKISSSIVDKVVAGATRPADVAISMAAEISKTYESGTAAGMFNECYYFSGSAAATPTTINLSTIVTADGSTGMTHVRAILIANDNTTDGHTLIYGGGTNAFTPELGGTTPTDTINPGTAKLVVHKNLGTTGHAVGSTVNVKLDPSANTVAFRIWIFGSN